MYEMRGFGGLDFTEWVIFKMIIKIHGEDRLIEILKRVKDAGGIKIMRTIEAQNNKGD